MRFALSAVLLSACTGSITAGGDDGPPVMPPPTTVQITVHDGDAPQPNVRVLFQNADGSLIAEVATDATGLATTEMGGGNITVIRTFPQPVPPATKQQPPEIYSYIGVKAGDKLELGHDSDDLGTPAAINVNVPVDAQGTVNVVTRCGSGQGNAPTVPLTVTSCPASVMFYVSDGDQSSFFAAAPYSVNVDLSTQILAGSLATTISSSNVTPDITSVNVDLRIMDGDFQLFSAGSQRVDTQPQTVNLPAASGVDELLVTSVSATNGTQMFAKRQPYAVAPVVVDASASLIPYVSTPTYSPTGVSWVEQGTGDADFVIAVFDVTTAPGTITPEYKRAIIAPHVGPALLLPLLTGADAMYNPSAADQIAGTHGLVKATGGYDAARAYAFGVSSLVQGTPMSSTVTLSYAGNSPPTL